VPGGSSGGRLFSRLEWRRLSAEAFAGSVIGVATIYLSFNTDLLCLLWKFRRTFCETWLIHWMGGGRVLKLATSKLQVVHGVGGMNRVA